MRIFMKFRSATLLVALLGLHPLCNAYGDDSPNAPFGTCLEPQRPIDDQDDEHWQGFLGGIEIFRSCVNQNILWHQEQAKIHSTQAREMADLWNQFVKSKLNAPVDFPHPSNP